MSITSFLNNIEVRKKFRDSLKYPVLKSKQAPLATPVTKNYSIVGTAFDYLLRFYIEGLNTNLVSGEWVAYEGLSEIERNESKEVYDAAADIYANAKYHYEKYQKDKIITDWLLLSLLGLAKLDIYYRSGYLDNINKVDAADIEDLQYLIELIKPEDWIAENIAVLNPTFGAAGSLVGGADADLIIDDMLIEIKTTLKLEVTKDFINQLIGYYILYKISGISGVNIDIELLKIGIYFSRFGVLKLYYIEDIIGDETTAGFIEWFKGLKGSININRPRTYSQTIDEKMVAHSVIYKKGKELEFYDKYYHKLLDGTITDVNEYMDEYIKIMEVVDTEYRGRFIECTIAEYKTIISELRDVEK